MSDRNTLNYWEQALDGNDNPLILNGTWKIDDVEVTASASSLNKNYTIIDDDYTILDSDYFIEVTSPNKTLTLPSAISLSNITKNIDNASSGVVYINTTSSQTINGESTLTIQIGENVTLVSNGSNWRIK